MAAHSEGALGPRTTPAVLLGLALPSLGLVAFAATLAWYADEGFQLVAALRIGRGLLPYRDFFYQHPPLYPYVLAAWMSAFGESWRSTHVLSALLSIVAAGLTARLAWAQASGSRWAAAGALTAGGFMLLYAGVVRFGSIAQPYALCLALEVAAVALTLASRDGRRLPVFGAGLAAGAAAASSLLALPVVPVLLLWLSWHRPEGGAWRSVALFGGGAILAWLPVAWLWTLAPEAVQFNLIEYHLQYRRVGGRFVTRADLEILAGWLESGQALMLGLLAGIGILRSAPLRHRQAPGDPERMLCAVLAATLVLYPTAARPAFGQYFVLAVPFLAILAVRGLRALADGLWPSLRPWWLVVPALGLYALAGGQALYRERAVFRFGWRDYEASARELDRVAPTATAVLADDAVYFAARRLPPPGLGNAYAYRIDVPPERAAALHLVSHRQLLEWLASGRFVAVATCSPPGAAEDAIGLRLYYERRSSVRGCQVFWDWLGDHGS